MKSLLQTFLLTSLIPFLAGAEGKPIQYLDLDQNSYRQVVVDREKGQYLGHPTTCLLEDGKTILCVYPKGHGRGGIVYKRSTDGGLTWSDRLPTPESWATSKEVPTLHRVIDADGNKRIIMWSGLYPARLSVTEDDGGTWSELQKVGDWGGIVVMGTVFERKTGPGHYMALFHDDGRFFQEKADQKDPIVFTLFSTTSEDGGLTWSFPKGIYQSSDVHLCEPGSIRSPDGKQIAVLLRENSRRKNSHIIFSDDEGETWSEPREMPESLNGDRHTGKYTDDGRLFISFRSNSPKGSKGEYEDDWVAWVGTWDDLVDGTPGQYHLRLKDNHKGADTAYPGVELLPDNTIVTTTYGHWDKGEEPYILSVRLKLEELDALALQQNHAPKTVFEAGADGYNVYRIPAIVAAANGDLLAFCEARTGGDASEIDMVLKRSSDGGKTWGELEVVLESDDFLDLFGDDPPEITIGNPAPVVDQLNPKHPGRLWLPFTLENDRVFVTYSDDSGKTWAPRREITKDVKKEPWGWYATGPVHSIQLQRAPHCGRLVIPCDHRLSDDGEDRGPNGVHAIISDDHGETWRIGALDETYDDELNANETAVVELNDGSLYFNTRDQNGKAPGTRGEASSNDGGDTLVFRSDEWEKFRPVAGVLDPPVVQCALLRAAEDLILFSGPDDNGPSGKGRSDMRIRYSTDEATTWQDGPLLHVGPAAYSDMVNLDNGETGILFEAGEPGRKNPYQRIVFIAVDQKSIKRK